MGILSSGCVYGIGASSSTMYLGMVLLCIYTLAVPFENAATCGSRFRGSSWSISEHGGNSKARECLEGCYSLFFSGYWEVLFAIHLGREAKGSWDTPVGIRGAAGQEGSGSWHFHSYFLLLMESHRAGMLLQPADVMALTCSWVQIPAWLPGTFLHPGTAVLEINWKRISMAALGASQLSFSWDFCWNLELFWVTFWP